MAAGPIHSDISSSSRMDELRRAQDMHEREFDGLSTEEIVHELQARGFDDGIISEVTGIDSESLFAASIDFGQLEGSGASVWGHERPTYTDGEHSSPDRRPMNANDVARRRGPRYA